MVKQWLLERLHLQLHPPCHISTLWCFFLTYSVLGYRAINLWESVFSVPTFLVSEKNLNGKLLLSISAWNWFQNLIQLIWVQLDFVITSLDSFALMGDKLPTSLLCFYFVINPSSNSCFSVLPCLNFIIWYSIWYCLVYMCLLLHLLIANTCAFLFLVGCNLVF